MRTSAPNLWIWTRSFCQLSVLSCVKKCFWVWLGSCKIRVWRSDDPRLFLYFFSFNPNPYGDRITFWSVLLGMCLAAFTMTTNQASVQRFCALKSKKTAQMWVMQLWLFFGANLVEVLPTSVQCCQWIPLLPALLPDHWFFLLQWLWSCSHWPVSLDWSSLRTITWKDVIHCDLERYPAQTRWGKPKRTQVVSAKQNLASFCHKFFLSDSAAAQIHHGGGKLSRCAWRLSLRALCWSPQV